MPSPLARQWLALDYSNAFLLPRVIVHGKTKGEEFRFLCILLFLASKYGNPFNYTDRELANNFGFHLSRIPAYKQKLESAKLICVALVKAPPMKWPKTFYLIFDFWND